MLQYGDVVQLEEQVLHTDKVGGSSPSFTTKQWVVTQCQSSVVTLLNFTKYCMNQIKVYTDLSNKLWYTDKCKISTGATAVYYQVYATALRSAPAVGNIYSGPPSVQAYSTKQIYVGVGNYLTVTGTNYTAQELGTRSSAQATSEGGSDSNNSISVNASTPQVVVSADGLIPVDSMTISPAADTYQTSFSAEFGLTSLTIDNITSQSAADVVTLANALTALPGATHPLTMGLGEVLLPGVYQINGAASIGGVLILDAQNNPDAVFVIKANGAINSGAASEVRLVNGTNPANIFWVSSGAIALGAASIFYGTAVAMAGAASIGASSYMIGRLLSTAGEVSVDGAQPLTIPSGAGPIGIPLGALETMVMFSAAGAVYSSGVSDITGEVGTNQGPTAGFQYPTVLNGAVYPVGSPGPVNGPVSAQFGIYVNDVLVPGSSVAVTANAGITSGTVTLSATVATTAGQSITVRTISNLGQLTINNRTLTITGSSS